MNRKAICVVAALTAALAAGAMAGCSSQPASSASASASGASVEASASGASVETSASAEASSPAAPEQTQAELIAELKAAIAGTPAFKTVTVDEEVESIFEAEASDESEASDASASAEASDASSSAEAGDASAEAQKIVSNCVYKFDQSGKKPKASMVGKTGDTEMEYYVEGKKAVLVTDGTSYSGKVKQFGLTFAKGFQAYLADTVGDLSTLADCAASIEKMENAGLTFYVVMLDPEKYIAADETLALMKDLGDSLKESKLSVGFDADGNIVSIDFGNSYEKGHAMLKNLVIRDYDNTVVEPMPVAEKTYKDMQADIQQEVDAFLKDFDLDSAAEGAASSAAAAEAEAK